jgi:hypothetical protein
MSGCNHSPQLLSALVLLMDLRAMEVAADDKSGWRAMPENSGRIDRSSVGIGQETTQFATRSLEKLEQQLLMWPEVSVHPHRFGGREFQFGNAEIRHIHASGVVAFNFHAQFATRFCTKALAKSITGFPTQAGLHFASAAIKISTMLAGSWGCPNLRYALKTAADASHLFGKETEQLGLSPRLEGWSNHFSAKLQPMLPLNRSPYRNWETRPPLSTFS